MGGMIGLAIFSSSSMGGMIGVAVLSSSFMGTGGGLSARKKDRNSSFDAISDCER